LFDGKCFDYSFVTGIESVIKQTCQHCAHFSDDPAFIESEIPGLTSFGSAYSSARGHAGICQELDRFMDPVPALNCPLFKSRTLASNPPSTGPSESHFRFREKE
jgi:hypothetical protein